MDLNGIRSVLELVALAHGLARQLARFTCGNKAGAKGYSHRYANHKASSLWAHDLGDSHAGKVLGEGIGHGFERLGIAEERRDVFKDDSGLGIVGDVDDLRFEVVHCMTFQWVAG